MSVENIPAPANLARRLWIYQAERFPLGKTSALLGIFTAASLNASALMAGRPLPDLVAYMLALFVALVLFFQMRACDEVKDFDDDRRFRPERPVPRGLVSLGLVVSIAGILGLIALIATWLRQPALVLPLLLVWVWLGLMTAEFFAPAWLKARPLLYLVSHMAIMPLIDLFVTAVEWMRHASAPAPGLWIFLAMSFANGCVLEIGRKLWAPEYEREGVETYSGLYGPRRAALMWMLCLTISFALLCGVGVALGAPRIVILPGAVAFALALGAAVAYRRAPSIAAQQRMDLASGLWVFACYTLAGFAPLLPGLF